MVHRHIVAAVVIVVAGLYAAGLRSARGTSGEIPALEQLPRSLNGWSSVDLDTDEGSERVLAATATLRRVYRREDGLEVGLSVAYFARQQVNSQIHSPRNCIPGAGWTVSKINQTSVALGGRMQRAARMLVTRNGQSREVLYWFQTQSGTVSGEYALKWYLMRSSLARRPTNAAFVRYDAALSDSLACREIMTSLDPALGRILQQAGLP